ALERRHRLGRLNRRNRLTRQTPLNEVRDHQKCKRNKRGGAPETCPRVANAFILRRGILQNRKLYRPPFFYILAFTTIFHKSILVLRRRGRQKKIIYPT